MERLWSHGLPATLPALTADGETWLLLLHDYPASSLGTLDETQAYREGGRAVAALAELGYQATIVARGCDVVVGSESIDAERYLALYFSREEEAQEVATRLALRSDSLFLGARIVQVHTRCLD